MPDPFEQIGPKLKEARMRAGLEVDEAARGARVPLSVAMALEAEDFSQFDSPVYAKSFLMQYSGFLGVDAQTWLDALEPGSFMASGVLLKGPEPGREKPEAAAEGRGGVMPVFILLLAASALVVAAIKGCESFEALLKDRPPGAAATDGAAAPRK